MLDYISDSYFEVVGENCQSPFIFKTKFLGKGCIVMSNKQNSDNSYFDLNNGLETGIKRMTGVKGLKIDVSEGESY